MNNKVEMYMNGWVNFNKNFKKKNFNNENEKYPYSTLNTIRHKSNFLLALCF